MAKFNEYKSESKSFFEYNIVIFATQVVLHPAPSTQGEMNENGIEIKENEIKGK